MKNKNIIKHSLIFLIATLVIIGSYFILNNFYSVRTNYYLKKDSFTVSANNLIEKSTITPQISSSTKSVSVAVTDAKPAASTTGVASNGSKNIVTTKDYYVFPILDYHMIRDIKPTDSIINKQRMITPPDLFEKEIKYLHDNGFNFITADQLVSAMQKGENLPRKSVIITLDDGHKEQYYNALPILKKYNATSTFYIYTDVVEKKYPVAMTWDQIKEVRDAGMTIGSHSLTHPNLNKIKDYSKLLREMTDSKKILEDNLNIKITSFAYPYGIYNDNAIKAVKEAGYTSAVIDTGGTIQYINKPLELKRFNMGYDYKTFEEIFQYFK